MNIICVGGRTVGPSVAWDLVRTFLAAEFSQAPRHLRRLAKVAPWSSNRRGRTHEHAIDRTPRTATAAELDQLSINTIRTLSIDAVERAKSGHPGTPMALAPLVYTIWNRVMRFDPVDPIWPNRDRFVLSNGHASMLLWSVLHLTGTRAVNAEYERLGEPSVTLDDIRRFRQIGSKAPGHPEYHWVSGVETTTGPARPGRRDERGDGDRAEVARRALQPAGLPDLRLRHLRRVRRRLPDGGRGSEAASLAGHLGLDNLCWIYDNNHITIEGSTQPRLHGGRRRRASSRYGWNVLRVGDANDLERIEHALGVFRETKGRPTLIVLDSHIGYGSPHKQDTAAAHGEPLGEEEVRLTKRSYGWPEDAQFLVPDGVREHFAAGIGARGAAARSRWTELFASYRAAYPELAERDRSDAAARAARGLGPTTFPCSRRTPRASPGRDASGKVLNVLAQNIPWFLGGSADLGPSNKTTLTYEGAGHFQKPRARAARTSTSASASTRWRRSSTASRCRSCGRSARRSSSSATTRGRPSGCRR